MSTHGPDPGRAWNGEEGQTTHPSPKSLLKNGWHDKIEGRNNNFNFRTEVTCSSPLKQEGNRTGQQDNLVKEEACAPAPGMTSPQQLRRDVRPGETGTLELEERAGDAGDAVERHTGTPPSATAILASCSDSTEEATEQIAEDDEKANLAHPPSDPTHDRGLEGDNAGGLSTASAVDTEGQSETSSTKETTLIQVDGESSVPYSV